MRHTTLLTATALLAIGAAACSSGSAAGPGSAAPGSTAAGSGTSRAPGTATVTATTDVTTVVPGSGTSKRSGVSPCATSQLRASIDPRHVPGNGTDDQQGRARHGVLVDFRNKSTSTCTLTGYPGAAIEDSSNKQVQQAKRTLRGELGGLPGNVNGYGRVTLKPGAYAAAMIEGVDTREKGAAQAGCHGAGYPRILVTPPNTTVPVPFDTGWPKCYSFDVHPVQALTSAPK